MHHPHPASPSLPPPPPSSPHATTFGRRKASEGSLFIKVTLGKGAGMRPPLCRPGPALQPSPAFSSPSHLSWRADPLLQREKERVIRGQCGGLKAPDGPRRSEGQPGARGGVPMCATRVYKTRGTVGTGVPRQPQPGQRPPPSPSSEPSPVFFPRTARR